MNTVDITPDEAFDSLSGFDEIAIKARFRRPVMDLRDDPMQFLRSLVFVMERRAGKTDQDAYDTAQGYTVGQVADYFAQAEVDLDPDAPETESGKDEPQPNETPST